MNGLELKILFKNSKAYLTNNRSITFQQQHLNDLVKNFNSFAYWTIRVVNHIKNENKLFCEVISYKNGKSDFENEQKKLANKLNDIKIISFRYINTSGLLSTLGKTSKKSNNSSNKYKPFDEPQIIKQTTQIAREPIRLHINETFYMPLKNVNFQMGYVAFEKKFHNYPNTINLKIENNYIKEEYDAVKNYFANVLKTKKIKVTVNIVIQDNEILSMLVCSPDINRINEKFVEEVRFEFVKLMTKRKTDPEKEISLFTLEEYFEEFVNNDFEPKTFYGNDEDFFEDLLRISNTKHYKHLRLLSSKHSHDIMRLRFIHRPFSFVFLIKGHVGYHFVWETLNTKEATYIWQIKKDKSILKDFLIRIEEIIKTIKINGKLEYINSNEDKFKRIYHDYSDSINGFIKWKYELESIIT